MQLVGISCRIGIGIHVVDQCTVQAEISVPYMWFEWSIRFWEDQQIDV